VSNRNASGSDGNAFRTIQNAIDSMAIGDHVIIRGGLYLVGNTNNTAAINIPTHLNGSSWNEGEYNSISSFTNEWAIIDGQNNAGTRGAVFGYWNSTDGSAADLKYWKFERLEIKNGRCASAFLDHYNASAFNGNGGPFWFRYCYLHDHNGLGGGHNPATLRGYHWHDSIIEYCYFYNNNPARVSDENSSEICTIQSYSIDDTVASNGYTGWAADNPDAKNNIVRYNYFAGGNVGYKYKGGTLFTGRTTEYSWDDTYNTYGDEIHHNIFGAYSSGAMHVRQDFAQIHHNIIDGGAKGIIPGYYEEVDWAYYKICIYNNTIMNIATLGGSTPAGAICRFVKPVNGYLEDIYGYDYNNIIDNCNYGIYGSYQFTVGALDSGTYDLSNYYNSFNYWYNPTNNDIIRLNDHGAFTQTEFEAQSYTHTPRVAYQNDYDAENLLYCGTEDAVKYKIYGGHEIETGIYISNGGVGGKHPYLSGVTLPSYIGATDPDDNAWVDGVLSLANVAILKNAGDGDPSWIEGGSSLGGVPGIPPSFEQN
jgi:hypothetical protein